MQLSSTLAWLVDAAAQAPSADRWLAKLGTCLVEDGVSLAGGSLTLAVPHPLIARRTWLWRAENGEVIEALGFAAGGLPIAQTANGPSDAGTRWLESLAPGEVRKDVVGTDPEGCSLGWVSPRSFSAAETKRLCQAVRFAAPSLAALMARARMAAALEAYLGRRSAARVLAGPLRRGIGETIQAALLFADLRGFTSLSESNPPAVVISALDAWFDRIAGPVHAFGGEVLKFIGDGMLAIFPVTGISARPACDAALRAVSSARVGMAHLDAARQDQGLPALPFGVALHLGEMLWGNIGAADRLDFTAIGPAVNLVSRLQGLCRPLNQAVLVSGAFAAESGTPLIALGQHALRGIARPCHVFTLPEEEVPISSAGGPE
ncbi:MAG: adenylate/guanylate cyclase domain-containing protein [Hyphomicrobiales bacterium]|nr:adenylate/guanylate cyclase domain-containing protein [Hyphomicrobiales bacterium]